MAGLGKGLDALLSDSRARGERTRRSNNENVAISPMPIVDGEGKTTVVPSNTIKITEIHIDKLVPSIYQPRTEFNEESLKELSLSILEHGLLEPLLVKKNKDKFEIICGERRFRAAKLAGLTSVPCLIRDVVDNKAYAIALIENLQREDLSPLEQAKALLHMQNELNMTQEDLAKTLGIARASVANLLRLNNLNVSVKEALAAGHIDMGHAKVLLSLDDEVQEKACSVIVKKALSVRQTEEYVKALKQADDDQKATIIQPAVFKDYEQSLSSSLDGAKVKFTSSGENKGKVTLSYTSEEQLNKIITILGLNK